jgi:hypothetical protein
LLQLPSGWAQVVRVPAVGATGRSEPQLTVPDSSQGTSTRWIATPYTAEDRLAATTRGRLNHLTAEDAANAPDVALGEFLVDSVLATVLFDTGAQFSYISTKFVKEMSLPTKPRPRPILTSSPLGEKRSTLECREVKLVFEGQLFTADLTVLESTGIGAILGMDWLVLT